MFSANICYLMKLVWTLFEPYWTFKNMFFKKWKSPPYELPVKELLSLSQLFHDKHIYAIIFHCIYMNSLYLYHLRPINLLLAKLPYVLLGWEVNKILTHESETWVFSNSWIYWKNSKSFLVWLFKITNLGGEVETLLLWQDPSWYWIPLYCFHLQSPQLARQK